MDKKENRLNRVLSFIDWVSDPSNSPTFIDFEEWERRKKIRDTHMERAKLIKHWFRLQEKLNDLQVEVFVVKCLFCLLLAFLVALIIRNYL